MILIKRAKGIALQHNRIGSGSTAGAYVFQSFEDYQEHDMVKEMVRIHRIIFNFDAECLPSMAATIAKLGKVFAAWRSGNKTPLVTTTALADGIIDKWLIRDAFAVFQVATEESITLPGGVQAIFDHTANPIPCNPYGLSLGVCSDQAGNFNDSSVDVMIEYEWVKSTQEDMSSFLLWEALGQ